MSKSETTPAQSKPRKRRLLNLLRKDRSGTTAIEFAIVAGPFLALLLAILEVSLVFFASFTLEHATEQAARLIRTGQAQQAGLSQEQFKTSVCDNVYALFDCTGGVKVEVQRFDDFNGISVSDPVDGSGNLKNDFTYDPGNGGDVVIVRVFYEWDLMAAFPGGLGNMGNGNRLLVAAATFRNEPFDN